MLLERQRTREYGWGGAVVRPLGACDSETLVLGDFFIVVHHAAVRRLAGLGEQLLESTTALTTVVCLYQLAPFTALPLASPRPNPPPPHTRNFNNTTSTHQYRYKISRRNSQDFPSHKPKIYARSPHRVPFTPPTTGHLPYLPGSSKNPPSIFSPLPIFTDRSLRISVGVLYC